MSNHQRWVELEENVDSRITRQGAPYKVMVRAPDVSMLRVSPCGKGTEITLHGGGTVDVTDDVEIVWMLLQRAESGVMNRVKAGEKQPKDNS